MHIESPLSLLAVSDSVFRSNAASVSGGAIDAANTSSVRVARSSFLSNVALNGGVAHTEHNAQVSFDGCTVRNNRREIQAPVGLSFHRLRSRCLGRTTER